MTPAVKLLDKAKISYQLHSYEHDTCAQNYGLEASEKLGINSNKVFKTLVTEVDSKQLVVAIIPVSQKLSLKAVAKAIGGKKAIMAEPAKVQASTGYVLGGVSPFGQKKRLKTLIDKSAMAFDTIYVSGGKRGLEIETCTATFEQILAAKFYDIAA
ncbi:Cys-tRNA(Pro) deacylase [Thalassotalea sp. 1_MG-2023]|uniref:Cys-tRNA(Pro) deacylase n=1 Tax=Thalassotalea sp. 1_MG-2023 TaxID=3062680 RepID=UPI0026E1FA99|nr:Cys-tRNA(Pro) deacylase [Thalassotalea sp. 1_MG-2023]MDO6428233.1 Cys-tRNA(Pro) deacylase [Thalassotalea sp. 1_MG-2023]